MEDMAKKKKQTPWPLVRERTIPTEQLPLVNEDMAKKVKKFKSFKN
jgi:hypothetical protein